MAIVILDGVDGVGKSYLARRLQDDYGYRWIKRAASDVHPLVDYTAELESIAGDVVCDRWHYSEWVYSRARRDGDPRLSDAMFSAVDQYLFQKGALAVHCWADLPDTLAVLEQRGELSQHPLTQLIEENKLFHEVFSRTIVPTLTVELYSADDEVERIHRAAKNWEVWACS